MAQIWGIGRICSVEQVLVRTAICRCLSVIGRLRITILKRARHNANTPAYRHAGKTKKKEKGSHGAAA
jgi:hypothetical protein